MTTRQGSPDVIGLVDHAIASFSDEVAVQDAHVRLTYAGLSRQADRVAAELCQLGVRPGDLVGLCLERSAGLVVGALGVLRAGAAYVAVDARYPAERVHWMLDDARAVAVVTDAARGDRPCVFVTGAGEVAGDAGDTPPPRPAPGLADLAYVVYTSGSTGRPKGVPVEHGSLANLVAWHRAAFGLTERDHTTQIASPGFDAAVWEIWPALTSGATLHILPELLRSDPAGLRDWLVARGVTVTFIPTALAETVIGLPWPPNPPLRFLLTGGDTLARRPPPGLGFAVVNNYGLSETAVVATSGIVDPLGEGRPTIGRPITGVTVEVVDEHGAPSDEGELLVGGVAVGPGYLGRDDLTAERFLDGRRYRTGDRVRQRPDGELEFLGRTDDQLSIRGFRVEPGEIAAALNEHPDVEASVSVGVGRTSGERQLVAYVVPAGDTPPDPAALTMFLGGFLPEHMIPSRFVFLDALPVTAHGKIDRDALPAPDAAAPEPAGRAPRDEVEAAVAGVIAELLELPAVGMDQNFFLLGGHSMLGAQLIARLEAMYDAEVSLRFLFDNPTPEKIAVEVQRQRAAGGVVAG